MGTPTCCTTTVARHFITGRCPQRSSGDLQGRFGRMLDNNTGLRICLCASATELEKFISFCWTPRVSMDETKKKPSHLKQEWIFCFVPQTRPHSRRTTGAGCLMVTTSNHYPFRKVLAACGPVSAGSQYCTPIANRHGFDGPRAPEALCAFVCAADGGTVVLPRPHPLLSSLLMGSPGQSLGAGTGEPCLERHISVFSYCYMLPHWDSSISSPILGNKWGVAWTFARLLRFGKP